MNKNATGIILIVVALVIIFIYAWPKMKPYVNQPAAPAGTEMTTGSVVI